MLQLSILPSLGDDEKPVMMTLGPPSTSNRSVHCGQQAPEIGPTALTVLDGTGNGPQYYFSATYNRTVILRGDQLGQEKLNSSTMQGQAKHTDFLPGQSLWRCTFNDTLLEGLIYSNNEGEVRRTNTASEANSALPYKLKLVETKATSAIVPYCEKVVVGLNVELEVEEGSESMELELAGGGSGTSQGDSDAPCACQWVVG